MLRAQNLSADVLLKMKTLLVFVLCSTAFFSLAETTGEKREIPEKLKDRIPSLIVNGKRVAVSREEYIDYHLKNASEKYALIAIPDG